MIENLNTIKSTMNPEKQIQQNKSNDKTAAKQIRSTIMKIEYVTPQKLLSLVNTKLLEFI